MDESDGEIIMGSLSQVPFLAGYNEQDQINRQRESQGMQAFGQMMTLQKAQQDMAMDPLRRRLIESQIGQHDVASQKAQQEMETEKNVQAMMTQLNGLPDGEEKNRLRQSIWQLVDRKQALDPEKAAPSLFGKVNPNEYTPASITRFAQTKNHGDLVAQAKPSTHINMPRQPHYEKDDAGNLMMIGPDGIAKPVRNQAGEQMRGRAPNNPGAEAIYKDYSTHPQVKEANDLEVKLTPLVDYMTSVVKTGKSVNANDAALAKLYIAVTTPTGARAYAMDQKALARLPDLGDRIGNMATSFFAGKDLTDQTRKEMFDYIKNHYQELDGARQNVKKTTMRRATARGIPAEQIFGKED